MKRHVTVGRSEKFGFEIKEWTVQNLDNPPELPELYEEVTISFYIDRDIKPIDGYVIRLIPPDWFVVRRGQRQTPKL